MSKEDSTEVENIAYLWLNFYKSFICLSAGATFADRDVINYLIEIYEIKQISKDNAIEAAIENNGRRIRSD